jgi:hypothetical protein
MASIPDYNYRDCTGDQQYSRDLVLACEGMAQVNTRE